MTKTWLKLFYVVTRVSEGEISSSVGGLGGKLC